MTKPRTRPVLLIGGPHHGSTVDLPVGTNQWHTGDPDEGTCVGPVPDAASWHPVMRAWATLDDAEDGQPADVWLFEVVAGERGMDRAAALARLRDAVTVAVGNGWLPTRHVPDPRAFLRPEGIAMIGGPL